VLQLKKAFYGLKQAPRAQNERIYTYLKKNRYEHCSYEHALCIKRNGENVMFVALYVDELIFIRNNVELIEGIKM